MEELYRKNGAVDIVFTLEENSFGELPRSNAYQGF
jgi:hypothetical protein